MIYVVDDNHRAPIVVTFLLAIHCYADPAEQLGSDHWNSDAGHGTRKWLSHNGLIELGTTWKTTEKGRAWIKMICATPMPVTQWGPPS